MSYSSNRKYEKHPTTTSLPVKKEGTKRLLDMDEKVRKNLEDTWNIEHAYYSSSLEGSNIDRNDFDLLAKQQA